MGSTGVFGKTADQVKKDLIKQYTWENENFKMECVDQKGKWFKCIRTIKETKETTLILIVVLMKKYGDEIVYKEMETSCHPYYYDCPKSWVDAFVPYNEDSKNWKENAIQFWNNKSKNVGTLEIGKVYKVSGKWIRVLRQYTKVQWVGADLATGKMFRFSKKHIDFNEKYLENPENALVFQN